jgi:methyl-accepting chemotaxis protein WspA
MNTSIWKRLNTTLALSIASLLLASGLAWWIERTRNEGQHLSDQLARENLRIRFNSVQISDALRALLLDPKGSKEQSERNRLVAATTDLKQTIDDLQKEFPGDPRIARPLKNLREFLPLTLDLHVAKVLELMEGDPAAAREFFVKTHPAIAKQRDDLVTDLTRSFEEVRTGTDVRAQTTAVIGSVGMVVILFLAWRVIRSASAAVTIPLNQLVGVIERMRNGDFTQRVTLQRKDEFGALGDGLNRLADDLSVLVGQVQRSGVQVNITATQISATAREQQSTTTEIAATTAEIGATSKQISATSRELDKTMNEVGEVAQDTAELAGSGQTSIAKMENTMRQIMDASGSISGKLAVLNEKTGNINTVVTTITKVADQTNLLSLNAAIEAEKAGEYGLGFAVVAMEIRRLADQTAVATYDIERMVKEMQSAVAAGVMGMDKFSEEVRRGVDEIRDVSTHLAQIIHQVQTLTPRFSTVSEGMHAQSTGAQQISETLTQLSEAAHQTADSLRQSNIAIEQLNEAARGLQTSVARFKLEAK